MQMTAAEREASELTAVARTDAVAIAREAAAALVAELTSLDQRSEATRAALVGTMEDEAARLVTRYRTLGDDEIARLAAFVVSDVTGLAAGPGR